MAKNLLLVYSEQLAADIEMLCRNIKAPSNTLFQIRKSSSSVYANICEANYGQSKADMQAMDSPIRLVTVPMPSSSAVAVRTGEYLNSFSRRVAAYVSPL